MFPIWLLSTLALSVLLYALIFARLKVDADEDDIPDFWQAMPIPAIFVALSIFVVWPLIKIGSGLLVDSWWFAEIGKSSVFSSQVAWRLGSGVFGFVITLGWLGFNQLVTLASTAKVSDPQKEVRKRKKVVRWVGTILALLASVFAGLIWFAKFELVLNAFSSAPLGIRDPVFGYDLSDYLFVLDFAVALRGWLVLMSLASILQSVLIHGYVASIFTEDGLGRGFKDFSSKEADILVRQSIRRIGFLLLVLGTGVYVLGPMRSVVDGTSTAISGAGFVDVTVKPTMRAIFAGTALLSAVLLAMWSWFEKKGRFVIPLVAIGSVVLVNIVCMGLIPYVVQQIRVEPRELQVEAPYLQYQLDGTRTAWGLASFEERSPEYVATPEGSFLRESAPILGTARIIDWTPTLDSFVRNDELMPAYAFNDVDVDRYGGSGYMLAVREMNHKELPSESRTWYNKTLVYTHGYGFVVVNVNQVSGDSGSYVVHNIPPQGDPRFLVEHNEIYFGELTTGAVVVNTGAKEIDYPSQSGESVMTSYEGPAGIRVGGFLRRFVLSTAFGDWRYMFSSMIYADSRILANRSVSQRTRKVLQDFLVCDEDPYAVISSEAGEVVYMRDCYSTSENYPYSTADAKRNYMRSSVVMTLGAWSGETKFWIKDSGDPIVQLLSRALPGIFDGTLADMPAYLLNHVRYPDDLIRSQAAILATHHMTSVEGYYRQDNSWVVANELIGNSPQQMDPRYVFMNMGDGAEFVSNMFFTPSGGKINLLGILTARCDPQHYGELILTRFPRDEQAVGPQKAEAQINQDEGFRNQVLALQQGKEADTTWGNTIGLMVTDPTGETSTVVYIKSLYVTATDGGFPTIAYVVGVAGDRVAFAKTLDEVLSQLYGDAPIEMPAGIPELEDGADLLEVIQNLWAQYKACSESGSPRTCEGQILDKMDALLTVPVQEPAEQQ